MTGMRPAIGNASERASERDARHGEGIVMLNERVVRALRESIRSVLQLELVLFFHENPETLDNARGLAVRLGLAAEDIILAMGDLVAAGVMVQSGEAHRAVYSYTSDPTVRAVVETDIALQAHTRQGRIELERKLSEGGEV